MKTIKTLFFLTLMFLGYGSVHAQKKNFTIGLKTGYVMSMLNKGELEPGQGQYNSDFRSRHGGTFGVFARIGGKNYIQPELNWDQTGGNFYYISPTGTNYHVISNVNRIGIPILYGHKFSLSKKIHIRANIGPEVNFRITGVNRHLGYIPSNYYWRAVTIAGVANIGTDIGKVVIDLRYNLGLTNANEQFDTKISYAAFTVGYKIF